MAHSLWKFLSNPQQVIPLAGRFRFLFTHYLLLKPCMFLLTVPKALERGQ